MTAALWTPRTLKTTRNGATQLTPGPWNWDFFKSPLALTQEYAAFWNHYTP